MSNAKALWALCRAELREQLVDSAYFVGSLVIPVVLSLVTRLVTGPAVGERALTHWGLIISGSLALTGLTNAPLARQQRVDAGVYRRVALTPVATWTVTSGAIIGNAVLSLPATLAAAGLSRWLGIDADLQIAPLLAWMALLWWCMAGLGAALSAMFPEFLKLKSAGNVVYFYILGTGGFFFDTTTSFPEVLLYVANPVWWWMRWGHWWLGAEHTYGLVCIFTPLALFATGAAGLYVLARFGSVEPSGPSGQGWSDAVASPEPTRGERRNAVQPSFCALGSRGARALIRVSLLALARERAVRTFELLLALVPAALLVRSGHAQHGPTLLFVGSLAGFAVAAAWELSRLRDLGLLTRLRCTPLSAGTILLGCLTVPLLLVAVSCLLSACLLVAMSSVSGPIVFLAVFLGACNGIGIGLLCQATISQSVMLLTWVPLLVGLLTLWAFVVKSYGLATWSLWLNPVSAAVQALTVAEPLAAPVAVMWMLGLLTGGVRAARRQLDSVH